MTRVLNVTRRRPNDIDIATPDIGGDPPVIVYRFEIALNFDDPFVFMQDVPRVGFRSPSIIDFGFTNSAFKNKIRFHFDPVDYAPILPGLSDISPFFMRMSTSTDGAVFTLIPGVHTIMPYDPSSDPPLILNGDAPNALTIAGSIEIQLPRNCDDMVIKNIGGFNLHIAFGPGGPEYQINSTERVEFNDATISQLFIRGEGGVVPFVAVCILQNSSVK